MSDHANIPEFRDLSPTESLDIEFEVGRIYGKVMIAPLHPVMVRRWRDAIRTVVVASKEVRRALGPSGARGAMEEVLQASMAIFEDIADPGYRETASATLARLTDEIVYAGQETPTDLGGTHL